MAEESAFSRDEIMMLLQLKDAHYQPLIEMDDNRSSVYTTVSTEQSVDIMSTTTSDTTVGLDHYPSISSSPATSEVIVSLDQHHSSSQPADSDTVVSLDHLPSSSPLACSDTVVSQDQRKSSNPPADSDTIISLDQPSCSPAYSDIIINQGQPPAEPSEASVVYEYFEHSSVQPEGQRLHCYSSESKARHKQPQCVSKICLLIFGAIYALTLLISLVVLLGAFNNNCGHNEDELMQISNLSALESMVLNDSLMISDLLSKIKSLELLVQQNQGHQENLSMLLGMSTDILTTKLSKIETQLVSNVTTKLRVIEAQLISNVSSLQSRLDSSFTVTNQRLSSAEGQLRTTSSRLDTVRNELTSTANNLRGTTSGLSSRLTTAERRLSSTSSNLNTLNNNLRRVNLFRRCISNTLTCRVTQHSSNTRWYLCRTGSQYIIRAGYYTVSMNCAYRLNDGGYIDQATLRSTTSSQVWCECDVISITSQGHFGTFNRTPRGECVLTIKRCPYSSNLLS